MLKRILSWPWAQAALWLTGIFALLVGAGGDYGPNWGPIVVGAVFVAAAIALGFLRLQRQRLERRSGSLDVDAPKQPSSVPSDTGNLPSQPPEQVSRAAQPKIDHSPRSGQPWWHGLVTVLAIALGAAGARVAINYFQSPGQQVSRMSDAELIERMEREVIATGDFAPTFVRMKRDFPEEYGQLTRRMVELVREDASESSAFIAGREFMSNFFEQRRATMKNGSQESLAAFLDAQVQLLVALGASDSQSCAEVIDTGRFEPGTGMALLPTISDALNSANNAMFDAILTGRSQPTEHPSVTDAEWAVIFQRADEMGADMAVLAAMSTPEFSRFSSQQRCQAVTVLYQAMNEADQAQRARFAVALMGP